MPGTDVQISICGSAGDGTIAAGDILKRTMAHAGYKVIAFDLYPAEIRGFGKCVSRVRITTEQTYSLKRHSDMLVSLDDSHAIEHVGEVRDFGAVVYEDFPMTRLPEGGHMSAHVKPGQVPYGLSQRQISERTTSASRSRNIVVLGFIAGLCRMPADAFRHVITAKFKRKGAAVVEPIIKAFDAGYEAGTDTFKLDNVFLGAPTHQGEGADTLMMTGNGAVVRGCLDAGIEAFFGYPITPATAIMERLAVEMPKVGGRMLQTEDEIAAIGATIGAGYAGVRAATATSGPGLALMTELMGLGAMAEVPAVAFVSQRGGPSTGMPTKTEQSDLNLAVHGVGRGWPADRPGADQRRRLLPLRRQGVRDGRGLPDPGYRADGPVPLQPLRDGSPAQGERLQGRLHPSRPGDRKIRALQAFQPHRGRRQPTHRARRGRRHAHHYRPRTQRDGTAQRPGRHAHADERQAT